MCGIVGTIDTSERRAEARVAMLNQAQRHRGPDHSVLARLGRFTLGNTRLAIQDPGPAGNQPFASPDGRYHCVFNGEIYNYRRLVDHYQLPVRTGCDGEVIPHLWAKLGPESLAELRGMFAIAIVDCLEERLYLARDPFGIKPLYWRVLTDGPVVFASEIRPLIQIKPSVSISSQAVARYLSFGAMSADQSPFTEIIALPPNSVASFDIVGGITVRPILPEGPLAATQAPENLGAALTESIDLHLAADVPTALLLSSGVDSAAIAAIGRRLGRSLNCLTVSTEDAVDESGGAAETALHYGHRFQRVRAALELEDVNKFFDAMQRPTIDGLNTYVVSKAVHEAGFKVALSGLGGDEAVGGYNGFRILRYLPALGFARRMPDRVLDMGAWSIGRLGIAGEAKAKRLLGTVGPRGAWGLSILQREVLPPDLVSELTGISSSGSGHSAFMGVEDRSASFEAMVAAEVEIYMQATLLPDADVFSMASSVELRVPFVDSHVFAASLALAGGTGRRPGKRAIGTSLRDPYLEHLATRRKHGFNVPMRRWAEGVLAPVLRAAEGPHAPVWSIVDRRAAERAGLIPLTARNRWADAWVIAVLNAWLATSGFYI
jgi:asparagine synthase (glutamine-hydrolysing)